MVDNILTAKTQVDSFKIYARLKDRYEEHRTSETVVETVKVNRLTTWQKVRLRLGYDGCGCALDSKIRKKGKKYPFLVKSVFE